MDNSLAQKQVCDAWTNNMPRQTKNSEKAGTETSGSLVEKVRQYSPGSHAPVSRTLDSSTENTEPDAPAQVDLISKSPRSEPIMSLGSGSTQYLALTELIQEVKNAVEEHKQTMTEEIRKIQDSQAKFQEHVDKQLQTLGNNLKTHIQNSVDEMRKYVDGEMGKMSSKITEIEEKVAGLEAKETPEYHPDVSIIMSKVPMEEDEDIKSVVDKIIHDELALPQVQVIRAMRLPQRNQNPGSPNVPPLIKVQLHDLETKKRVLREKKRLQNSANFQNVWIRTSKPHSERIMEMNCRTILELMGPKGKEMFISGSGKIVKKNN